MKKERNETFFLPIRYFGMFIFPHSFVYRSTCTCIIFPIILKECTHCSLLDLAFDNLKHRSLIFGYRSASSIYLCLCVLSCKEVILTFYASYSIPFCLPSALLIEIENTGQQNLSTHCLFIKQKQTNKKMISFIPLDYNVFIYMYQFSFSWCTYFFFKHCSCNSQHSTLHSLLIVPSLIVISLRPFQGSDTAVFIKHIFTSI